MQYSHTYCVFLNDLICFPIVEHCMEMLVALVNKTIKKKVQYFININHHYNVAFFFLLPAFDATLSHTGGQARKNN